MAELTDAHIKEILEAAVSAGLAAPARRALLFAGVDAFYWQSIDGQDSPLDQLRADLNALRESASDGEPEYFARWLSNAAQMARPKRQARVFEAMGAHLGGGAPESSAGEAVGHSRGPATMAGSDGKAPQVGGETPFFSWVHLSDIHFSHGDAHEQWDQALVLDKIIKDFKQFTAEGIPSPDVVLVTGDLAYSGGADNNKRC